MLLTVTLKKQDVSEKNGSIRNPCNQFDPLITISSKSSLLNNHYCVSVMSRPTGKVARNDTFPPRQL